MAVYVDNAKNKYGNLILCHMLADTDKELTEMAIKIGLDLSWKHRDHFDISIGKRALAVKFGAKEITQREAVVIRKRNRDMAPEIKKSVSM